MEYSIPQALDNQLHILLPKIQAHPYLKSDASRHLRIRINTWISKLESIISNNIWRKNRNTYLRLLYIMMECKQIMEPFTTMVPQELPTLHKHQINCILLKLSTKVKERERDKENKQIKASNNKAYPTHIWNTLEQEYKNTMNQTTSNQVTNYNNANNNNKYQVSQSNLNLGPYSSIAHTVKSTSNLYLSNVPGQNRNNNLQSLSMGMDVLSPISQAMHLRGNSNFSECTYSSIEKFRDMLTPKQKIMYSEHQKQTVLKQCTGDQLNKERMQDNVKYFKKNRQASAEKTKQDKQGKQEGQGLQNSLRSKQFYNKVFKFLQKHKDILQEDVQYVQVMGQLKQFIMSFQNKNIQIEDELRYQNHVFENSHVSRNMAGKNLSLENLNRNIFKKVQNSKQRQYLNYTQEDQQSEIGHEVHGLNGKRRKYKRNSDYVVVNNDENIGQLLVNDDQNSYDYISGKYSQYSSIQMDQGLSNSKIQNMNQKSYIDQIKQQGNQHSQTHNNDPSSLSNKIACERMCYKIMSIGVGGQASSHRLGKGLKTEGRTSNKKIAQYF